MEGSFDAVVQPLDFHLDGQKGLISWWKCRKLHQASDDLRAGIEHGIERQAERARKRASTTGIFAAEGITSPGLNPSLRPESRQCIAHMIIERRNFLLPLLEYAASIDATTLDEFYQGASKSRYQHLLDHDINSGVYVPVDFETPFYYRSPLVPTDVSVGSSIRLEKELRSVNRRLGIDVGRRLPAMREFVRAGAAELAERAHDERFWVQFAFLVLSKLVQCSIESRLPILLR